MVKCHINSHERTVVYSEIKRNNLFVFFSLFFGGVRENLLAIKIHEGYLRAVYLLWVSYEQIHSAFEYAETSASATHARTLSDNLKQLSSTPNVQLDSCVLSPPYWVSLAH